jgi:hypothetical protein
MDSFSGLRWLVEGSRLSLCDHTYLPEKLSICRITRYSQEGHIVAKRVQRRPPPSRVAKAEFVRDVGEPISGRLMQITVPWFGELVTSNEPPCISARSCIPTRDGDEKCLSQSESVSLMTIRYSGGAWCSRSMRRPTSSSSVRQVRASAGVGTGPRTAARCCPFGHQHARVERAGHSGEDFDRLSRGGRQGLRRGIGISRWDATSAASTLLRTCNF